MLKEIPGCETVQHLCESMSVNGQHTKVKVPYNPGEKDGVKVLMHDIHPYLFVEKTKQMIHIKYCPFCSVYIDGEERP